MISTSKTHLAKYLKECGNFTKSEVKELILKNRVLVNNRIEPLSYIIRDDDIITIDGKTIKKVPLVYYIYNKPIGIVCTNNTKVDKSITNTLNLPYRVFCVGRLDKQTRGLILLTNDGHLANNLLNPASHVEKEYIVQVKYPIDNNFIEEISKPIILRGKTTLPAKAYLIDNYTFGIILKEGKYHQIRRLVIYNHNTVVDLIRIRFGNILLNGLQEGTIKEIQKENIIKD